MNIGLCFWSDIQHPSPSPQHGKHFFLMKTRCGMSISITSSTLSSNIRLLSLSDSSVPTHFSDFLTIWRSIYGTSDSDRESKFISIDEDRIIIWIDMLHLTRYFLHFAVFYNFSGDFVGTSGVQWIFTQSKSRKSWKILIFYSTNELYT